MVLHGSPPAAGVKGKGGAAALARIEARQAQACSSRGGTVGQDAD
jgi:hypothetical protein